MTKTIKRVIAGVSALAIIAGAAVGGWAINEYVIKDNQFTITDQAYDSDGGMQIGEAEGSGISLMSAEIAAADYAEYGISPMAESAQQLTATITPSNATNQKVDWTVKWKNASSSWANGKTVTDYVTVTPTADGALTANVECKKEFGEQVIVTCTSRQNTEASATANVDYAKRVTSVTNKIGEVDDTPVNLSFTSSGSSFSFTQKGTISPSGLSQNTAAVYSVGTVEDSFTFTYYITLSSDLINALKEQGFTTRTANKKMPVTDFTSDNFEETAGLFGSIGLSDTDYNKVFADAIFGTGGTYNKFGTAMRSIAGKTAYTLTVEATGRYSSFTGKVNLSAPASNYDVKVQSVGGLTNIVF